MKTLELLSKLSPAGQQRLYDLCQVRQTVKEFANADVEFGCANDADFEAEVAQQAANIILKCNRLLLQQLAGGQEGAPLLAGQGFYMNRSEQIHPHHLRNATCVVAVTLVHLCLEECLRMAGLDADDRQTGFCKPTE